MLSIHTPPAQAVLTVNVRKFRSLYSDDDNTIWLSVSSENGKSLMRLKNTIPT